MPKAKSLSGKTEVVRRWKIYTDGRVEDPHGHIHPELPIEIGFSPQCVSLAIRGIISLEGVVAKTESVHESETKVETKADTFSEPVLESNSDEGWTIKKKGKK